jgi:hypothetical protein
MQWFLHRYRWVEMLKTTFLLAVLKVYFLHSLKSEIDDLYWLSSFTDDDHCKKIIKSYTQLTFPVWHPSNVPLTHASSEIR